LVCFRCFFGRRGGRRFSDSERQDLLDLAAWWRRRVAPSDAAQLEEITRKLRPRPILIVLPWLAAGFVAVLIIILMSQGDSPNRLWELIFKHSSLSPGVWDGDHWLPVMPLEQQFFGVWMSCLCLGYLIQWYAVRSHAAVVHSLVDWTNKVGRENSFMRIKNDACRVGLNPLWIFLGIEFCANNIWWAIPMVFAGAMQRRYSMRSSPALRVALANQTRDAFAIVQNTGDHFCAADHCGARLPAPARFCPRCGTAV